LVSPLLWKVEVQCAALRPIVSSYLSIIPIL
jgi:hypothetical protein